MRRVNSLALLLAISAPAAMAYDGPHAQFNFLPPAGSFASDPQAGDLHPGRRRLPGGLSRRPFARFLRASGGPGPPARSRAVQEPA